VIVEWADEALADVERIYSFLAAVDLDAALHAAERLETAPNRLIAYPRIGERLEGFENRELRRILIGKYEMRYEIREDVISIVRIFHGREDRSFGDG
jgi:plasmid stabilization system protein ParE